MQKLKGKKGSLIDEKKAIRAQLDQAKNEGDKLMKDRKDAKANIKFSSLEEIEKEIKKLQRKQETTTMSLTEEKKLIKDIDALKNSKQFVAEIKSKDSAMDGVKEQRKNIGALIAAKDKEIDEVSKEIDEKMVAIKAMNEKDSAKRDKLQTWFKERDDLRNQFTAKLKEKDAIRAAFREANNEWYNAARAVRAQKQIQWEADKEKREAEEAEYKKKLEEEEAKKIPYEAEQALCDYLADYLEKTYLSGDDAAGAETKKEEAAPAIKDDPFANFKPMKKNDDEIFFGKGKSKKKRERTNKKQDKKETFTLSVDTFEQFGLIGLNPPTALAQVEGAVKELRERKEWYSKQPRGSVPTATDIRKANEKTANKLRQNGSGDGEKKPAASKGGKFSLSSDDFAPLPGANSGGNAPVSLWGKPVGMAPPSSDAVTGDPTPEEAAQS